MSTFTIQARSNIMSLATQLPVDDPEQLLQNNEITKSVMAFKDELNGPIIVSFIHRNFYKAHCQFYALFFYVSTIIYFSHFIRLMASIALTT
jgi:hypothetical protein